MSKEDWLNLSLGKISEVIFEKQTCAKCSGSGFGEMSKEDGSIINWSCDACFGTGKIDGIKK